MGRQQLVGIGWRNSVVWLHWNEIYTMGELTTGGAISRGWFLIKIYLDMMELLAIQNESFPVV